MDENRYELPNGWEWTKLGDICVKPQYGWTTSAIFNGKGLKLLRTTDISSGTINWDTVPFCEQEPDNPQKYLLHRGDIVVSRAGSVGISIQIDECPKSVFASYLIRFKPILPIEQKYVSLYLKSPDYWNSITNNTAGITIPNVNASKLEELSIPLPPEKEQKRIVAKIEVLLARVNKTRAELARIPPLLKKFRQSVLAKAFAGELTKQNPKDEPASVLLARIKEERKKLLGKKYKEPEPVDTTDLPDLPEGWEWTRIESVAEIVTGNTPSKSETDNYGDFLPWVKPPQLECESPIKDTPEKLSKKGASLARVLPEGATLVSCIGILGKIGLSGCNLATNQQINSLVFEKAILPKYGNYYCKGLYFRDWMQREASATTVPILNKGRFSEAPFPIAPINEQKRIVERIEALFTLADKIAQAVEQGQRHCDRMTQSILAKAFRGELVAQDPADEPASALLERIQKERVKNRQSRGTTLIIK